jgi:Na+:H+ antiporter, NhaC family
MTSTSGTPPVSHTGPGRVPREPSMLDAVLPIVVLIGLLALTIALFGIDATNGPLQVALLLSAAFASLMAFKNGYTVAGVADAAVGGVTSAVGAIFILLAVGALIGTWNMAGTIPTIVDYGIRLVSPTWFYLAAAVVCALVGMVTGSSWTTAGTLGVAFVGMAKVMGLNEAAVAGAVICGAYFGDKMTPLSETTILVPKLVGGGLTVGEHVRNMFWTAGPALGVSLVIFFFLGLNADADASISTDAARKALASAFNIGFLNLLPLLLLVVFSILKFPPFLSILGSALFAGILAPSRSGTRSRPSWTTQASGRSRPRSRPSTSRWRPGSSAIPGSSRSTTCSRAAGWRAC